VKYLFLIVSLVDHERVAGVVCLITGNMVGLWSTMQECWSIGAKGNSFNSCIGAFGHTIYVKIGLGNASDLLAR
jgi:hypothetical protein